MEYIVVSNFNSILFEAKINTIKIIFIPHKSLWLHFCTRCSTSPGFTRDGALFFDRDMHAVVTYDLCMFMCEFLYRKKETVENGKSKIAAVAIRKTEMEHHKCVLPEVQSLKWRKIVKCRTRSRSNTKCTLIYYI